MAQGVELAGANARFDVWFDEIEHFGSQFASHAHFFDVFGSLEGNAHIAALLGA